MAEYDGIDTSGLKPGYEPVPDLSVIPESGIFGDQRGINIGGGTPAQWFVLYLDAPVSDGGVWRVAPLQVAHSAFEAFEKLRTQKWSGVQGLNNAHRVRVIRADQGEVFTSTWGPSDE